MRTPSIALLLLVTLAMGFCMDHGAHLAGSGDTVVSPNPTPGLAGDRVQTVEGQVTDGSPAVEITVRPSAGTPGGEQRVLVPVDYPPGGNRDLGHFAASVPLFPGPNQVDVRSATSLQVRQPRLDLQAPTLRVTLDWGPTTGNFDYDLHVHHVDFGRIEYYGGELDRDAGSTSWDSGPGLETITFPQAGPGLYPVYAALFRNRNVPAVGGLPTTVRIYFNEREIYRDTRTLTAQFAVWSVATVVIHGSQPGGCQVVGPSGAPAAIGRRDLLLPADGRPLVQAGSDLAIIPWTDVTVDELTGPQGTRPVTLAKGQSAQFRASGMLSALAYQPQQPVDPERRSLLAVYHSSNPAVATIDDTGVLTALAPGQTTISVGGSPDADWAETSIVTATPIAVTVVDLDIVADTDRDGVVDRVKDGPLKETWSRERGAIYIVNVDDDDADYRPDAVSFDAQGAPTDEDLVIENDADVEDIAPVLIPKLGASLPSNARLVLRAETASQIRGVHVFPQRRAGATAFWGGLTAAAPLSAREVVVTDMVRPDADNEFGVEGLLFRNLGDRNPYEGFLDLTLALQVDGRDVSASRVRLRVAPWMVVPATQPSVEFWARNTLVFSTYAAIAEQFRSVNDEESEGYDFFQDAAEMGWTQRPGAVPQTVALETPNRLSEPLLWVVNLFLRPNVGLFSLSLSLGDDAGPDGGSSGSYGGNIEAIPPTARHPLGQILIGDTRSDALHDFLASQEAQPVVTVPTRWLQVGHVDEMVSFTGNGNEALIADPAAAIAILEAIPPADRGRSVLFAPDRVKEGRLTADPSGLTLETDIDFTDPALPAFRWIRFFDSSASGSGSEGQVGIVSRVAGRSIVLEAKFLDSGRSIIPQPGGTRATESWAARFNRIAPQLDALPRPPRAGDRFVLIEDTMTPPFARVWIDDSGYWPAAVTVHEVLADRAFVELNTRVISARIAEARRIIAQASDGEVVFRGMPALFHHRRYGIALDAVAESRACVSFIPNAVNLVPVAGRHLMPRQEGAFTGYDPLQEAIAALLPTAAFVETWRLHMLGGNVHCATNVVRSPQPDWFRRLPRSMP